MTRLQVAILASIADYEGAVERAIKFAKAMLNDARNDLVCLAAGAHQTALIEITGYLDKLLDKCRAVV